MTPKECIIYDSLSLIESMVEQNLTDKEIADKIGVTYSTFKRFKAQNSELKSIIAQGKDKKNQTVEQSLFKGCNGYKYYEEVVTKVKTETMAADGVTILVSEDVVISNVKKYKGPDLASQKYWLNNKNKAKWKDDPNKVANDIKLTKLKEIEVNSKVLE